MNWFFFAVAATLAWGFADLFYKKGADDAEPYSHLKTSIAVGFVMGLHAIFVLLFGDIDYDFVNLICYLPVSAMYILSMTIGYFGLRYLELSVSSPIQNASGAVSCILLLIVLQELMDLPTAAAVLLICAGVLLLGIFERQEQAEGPAKYRIGFAAFFMPILYCVIDSFGTFLDGYYLDDIASTPLRGVTEATLEDVANTSYELTFLLVAILLFVYVFLIKKEPFRFPAQKDRLLAAVFETGGQFAYVYAMSGRAVIAAPMIASYSIVSVLLSRLFLKEKLSAKKYAAVGLVLAGIVILGILEGLE